MMKGIIACYLLMSTMGLGVTLTAGAYSTIDYAKLADALLNGLIISTQDDDSYTEPTTKTSPSNEDVDSIAEIQGVFNVLAQIDLERAKLMGRKNSDTFIQFWKGIGKSLWNKGKSYLRKNLCYPKEQIMKEILQELTSEEMGNDDDTNSNDDEEVRAQLQVLFNALQKVEANIMQKGNSVEVELLGNSITDMIKSVTKGALC